MLKKERGFLLITLYMLLPLLLILGGAMVTYAWSDIRASLRTQASTQAFYFAEAGLDNAIVQLRNTGSLSGFPSLTSVGSYGTYSVVAEDLGSNRMRLTSTGTSTYVSDPTTKAVESIVKITPAGLPAFENGLFGDSSLTMSGNAKTDSFNSSHGAYSAGTAGANGDVATNGIIALSGNSTVNGDALVAPTADPETNITTTGNAEVTGTEAAAEKTTTLKPIVVPPGLASSGPLTLSGDNQLTLAGGTYRYDSLQISGNAHLSFSGKTTLYVSSIAMSGNSLITGGNLPPNVLIYVTGSSLSMSGNAQLYGGIYAPSAAATLSGNAKLYGAVMANTVSLTGNSRTSYDEDVKTTISAGGSSTTVDVLSWGVVGEMTPTSEIVIPNADITATSMAL